MPLTKPAFPAETDVSPRLTEYKAVRGFERAFALHFHPEWSVALVRRGTSRAARDYPSYADNLAALGADELRYVGIALAGEKKDLMRLTGSLPLFR